MGFPMKRKWRRGSKSHHGNRDANKVLLIGRLPQDEIGRIGDCSFPQDIPLGEPSTEDAQGASKLMGIRKGGSKLLSMVGLQRRSDISVLAQESMTPIEGDIDMASRDNTAHSDHHRLAALQDRQLQHSIQSDLSSTLCSGRSLSSSPSRVPGCLPISGEALDAPRPKLTQNEQHPPLPLSECRLKGKGHSKSRQTAATPTFAHQLSHKISASFSNPTVVHKPNMRTRPSIISLHDDQYGPLAFARSNPGKADQESTAPSSFQYSGSVSAGGCSTAPTSLGSRSRSTPSILQCEAHNQANHARNVSASAVLAKRENSLTPIQEAPSANPTILTVETTANAKAFFETHYDPLLAGDTTPRSLRRRYFEEALEVCALPEAERHLEWRAWASNESINLRQTRVLKSRTNSLQDRSGVSVAGYEVIRILGKGSFGVVRLVREKEHDPASAAPSLGPTSMGSAEPASQPGCHSPKDISPKLWRSQSSRLITSTKCCPPKSTKDVYAMKVIRKSDMLRNCQEGHLRAERDFLVASENSNWVVPLTASFQDNTNLYLVMEYMVGGDFLGLLFRRNILKERHARWYIAEMTLCVEETHRHRWIHRDIKPDNFLISASGHLKISDFGLAFDGHWSHDQRFYKNHRKSLMDNLGIEVRGDCDDQEEDTRRESKTKLASILTGRTRASQSQTDVPCENESILQWRNRQCKRRMAASIVGTSQYMAPEVIRGAPYDGRCDWWSIGIILYECLYGFTPFVCENREDTKARILDNRNSLVFPRDIEYKVSCEAIDLINGLLQEKGNRLCSRKYMLNDYQHSRHDSGRLVNKYADPTAVNYKGRFVYPDDATDIKNHPFFSRIAWDRHHLTRPPFVPDVDGWDDTKYFDEEEPISDVDDSASHAASENPLIDEADLAESTRQIGAREQGTGGGGDPGQPKAAVNGLERANKEGRKGKARGQKRPRDKVLRDKEVGRKALELRKKGSFIGYEYRRPKLLAFDDEKGSQRQARRSLKLAFEGDA